MAANNTQQGDEVLADDTKRLRDAWLAGKASGRVGMVNFDDVRKKIRQKIASKEYQEADSDG